MSEQTGKSRRGSGGPSGWAAGFAAFAGIILLVAGSLQAIMGLVGIVEDEFFVVTRDYFLKFDATTWGWIHLLFGLAVALAGLAVLRDRAWGRTVAVVLAGVSMLTNFAFLPYYPAWTLVLLTLDVVIIWALTAGYRGDY